jgi:hypothetical protein
VELRDLIGKEAVYKGNKCPIIDVDVNKAGANVLKLSGIETKKARKEIWVDIDECRISVFLTNRPALHGIMVDAYDGYAKGEWKDADGWVVPYRIDPNTYGLMLTKDNRPIMTMKIIDIELEKLSPH